MWSEERIDELVKEGRIIQKRLSESKICEKKDNARTFANLMFHGKVSAAVRFLHSCDDAGLMKISNDVIHELKEKHPGPSPIAEGTLLNGPVADIPESYFDNVNVAMISKAAVQTQGACGPSGMDADLYRLILTSKNFKTPGGNLRSQIQDC